MAGAAETHSGTLINRFKTSVLLGIGMGVVAGPAHMYFFPEHFHNNAVFFYQNVTYPAWQIIDGTGAAVTYLGYAAQDEADAALKIVQENSGLLITGGILTFVILSLLGLSKIPGRRQSTLYFNDTKSGKASSGSSESSTYDPRYNSEGG